MAYYDLISENDESTWKTICGTFIPDRRHLYQSLKAIMFSSAPLYDEFCATFR